MAHWPRYIFGSKWPSFKLDLEIINTYICSNINDDNLKNVASGVLTKFSFDLAWFPSFWPQVTQYQTWPGNHPDILSKIHNDYLNWNSVNQMCHLLLAPTI